jgi:hypothetical protein
MDRQRVTGPSPRSEWWRPALRETEIGPEPDHEDGLPRRWKLVLIELAGLVLLGFGVSHIGLGADWHRGVPILVLGAFVLLNPAQIVRFVERFFPN